MPLLRRGAVASHVVGSYTGLFYWIIAAIIKRMTPHNPPQGHERSAKDTMAFDRINSILGTGRCKAAYRGEQGGDKDLVCLDQEKNKAGNASLQKIFHESLSFLHQVFPGRHISQPQRSGTTIRAFLKKNRCLLIKQSADGLRKILRVVQIKTFPYRDNYIHERQLAALGIFSLKEIFV